MLSPDGYKRKTYDELLEEMTSRAKQLFGANINTSELSVIGILIRVFAWIMSLLWKDNEDIYYSAYLNTAEGVQLDRLLPYSGITRNLDTYAFGTIKITGTPNYTVPSGFLVSTDSDLFFETIEDVTLDSIGDGTVEIRCVESGRIGNVTAGTIVEIVNPNSNVESIVNLEPTSGGRERETDQEVRERALISTDGLGTKTTSSIRTAILGVPGVRAATVIENFSDNVDIYGTPPRSFQAFVLGGNDSDIASAILNKKAAGIQPYGETYVNTLDDSSVTQLIGFTKAQEVSIHLKVTVQTNASFPSDGPESIKSTLIQFIGGADIDGILYAGLNMGDDVIESQLIRSIKVEGIKDLSIELSRDGIVFSRDNIVIDPYEVAQTSYDYIEVVTGV